MFSSLHDGCSKSKLKGLGQTGSSLMSWRDDKYGWQSASSTANRCRNQKLGKKIWWCKRSNPAHNDAGQMKFSFLVLPVMRLLGSNTSIFSSRSTAPGDMLGNLAANCCFRHWGNCFMYLRALSLRRNPRLASSGEPSNFTQKRMVAQGYLSHPTSTYIKQIDSHYWKDETM